MAERALAQDPTYSAIPTVRVDGAPSDKVTSQLLGMDVREREAGMASLELRLTNFGSFAGGDGDFMFEDGTVLKLGAALQVFAGDVSSPSEIFRGKISGLEGRFPRDGGPELVVLAEDLLQAARMKRRTKTWENATLAKIVRALADDAGLTPVVAGLDAPIGTQQQFNESDLHFARRLLARYDADLQVSGGELHATPRAQAHGSLVEIDLNSQLREVRVVADLAHQVSAVTASGWDFTQGRTVSVTSRTGALGPGMGTTGADWLQKALATRSDQLAQFSTANQDEAQALVDTEFAERVRRFVVAHGVAEGNPALRVGSLLKLNGLGARFSNTYYTTATTHHFDTDGGYETRFVAECAYLGGAA